MIGQPIITRVEIDELVELYKSRTSNYYHTMLVMMGFNKKKGMTRNKHLIQTGLGVGLWLGLYITLPTSGYRTIFCIKLPGVMRPDGLFMNLSAKNWESPTRETYMMYSFVSSLQLGQDTQYGTVVGDSGSNELPSKFSSLTCQHSSFNTHIFNIRRILFCCILVSSAIFTIGVI